MITHAAPLKAPLGLWVTVCSLLGKSCFVEVIL
jgi:hypothetical protein